MTAAALIISIILSPAAAQTDSPVAGGVVRSREWKVRRAPEKEEEFSGDVSYRNAASLVKADWALYRHAPRTWRARGNVFIERTLSSGDVLRARGDEGTFDQKTSEGALTAEERVSFQRAPADGGPPDQGEAGRAQWRGREEVHLRDHVRVWGPRLEAEADRADYVWTAHALTLTGGRPVVRKLDGEWTGVVKADTVTAEDDPRRLAADGNARGWILFKRAPAAGTGRR
jgi:lipopolysaccharide export system protein LptA